MQDFRDHVEKGKDTAIRSVRHQLDLALKTTDLCAFPSVTRIACKDFLRLI